jgi:cyclase
MLKKRLIFTLLYNDGYFVLSRNFRLQKVGNIDWLKQNYNFSKISSSIDELIVLDITRGPRNTELFCETLKSLCDGCFVPIAAGGGIRGGDHARQLLRSGADKVVLNTPLYDDRGLLNELSKEFGQQCIVGSVDVKQRAHEGYQLFSESGTKWVGVANSLAIRSILDAPIGELYLNSIDQDGTGQGYDLKALDLLPTDISKPVIIAGGVGNSVHLVQGLSDHRVDAVATAHLFNFIGDGLKNARQSIKTSGIDLPMWNVNVSDIGTMNPNAI